MEIAWDSLMSTLFGGSLAVGVAKYFINRTLDKIDLLPEKMSEIKSQLSSMSVKLESLERLHIITQEHDRKITMLETAHRIKGSHAANKRYDQNC